MNRMHPLRWIPGNTERLLDVGCNAGALLADCMRNYPGISLAGVDVNQSAVETARAAVPGADIRRIDGPLLPFADGSFDTVTCIEVIEHIPADDRALALREMARVLAPDGTLILRCPHKGVFDWLDSNNFRFRFPRLYQRIVRRGLRDDGYSDGSDGVIWHHHFTHAELAGLLGAAFELKSRCFGGLALFPLADILRWPFYRKRLYGHPLLKALDRLAEWDIGVDYGGASFTILLTLRRLPLARTQDGAVNMTDAGVLSGNAR